MSKNIDYLWRSVLDIANRRDLPPNYGKRGVVYQHFIRWRDKRIWETLLEILIDEPRFELLMIVVSHYQGRPDAIGVGIDSARKKLNAQSIFCYGRA